MLAEPARRLHRDVHATVGLGCADCHGGDPSSAVADDLVAAKSDESGFRGKPTRLEVADFCARCHSDAQWMRRYNPQLRVDQLTEYRTSVHGQRNMEGDPVPATCIDCHGVHGILRATSPDSPVYPTNVPQTCAHCHADADKMAPYGLPTNQYADYRESGHAFALLVRGDTAAPACNDCHGNHGAAPPGVKAVANVCGQCHAREAGLFRESFKRELFDSLGAGECAVCHDNHRILHPTPELFWGGSAPRVSQGRVESAVPFAATVGDLDAGGTAVATWMAVLDPHVEAGSKDLAHVVSVSAAGLAPLELDAIVEPGATWTGDNRRRASSDGLGVTLDIEAVGGAPVLAGDTLRYQLEVRATGDAPVRGVRLEDRPGAALQAVEGSVCMTCHEPGDRCDVATKKMYKAVLVTNTKLRAAQARLHEAEIAGMEVSEPKFALSSKGVTAAVEARALIHTFDVERLIARTNDANSVADAALEAGHAALAEVQYRRKGLAVSLVLVGLVLLGLFLKIQKVDRARRQTGF